MEVKGSKNPHSAVNHQIKHHSFVKVCLRYWLNNIHCCSFWDECSLMLFGKMLDVETRSQVLCLERKQWYGTVQCHGQCFHGKKLWSRSEDTSNNLAQQTCLCPNGIKAVGILTPRSGLLLCSMLSLGISTHSPQLSQRSWMVPGRFTPHS